MKIIVTEGTSLILIGKQGENNAVPILFKVNTWMNKYGEGADGGYGCSYKKVR